MATNLNDYASHIDNDLSKNISQKTRGNGAAILRSLLMSMDEQVNNKSLIGDAIDKLRIESNALDDSVKATKTTKKGSNTVIVLSMIGGVAAVSGIGLPLIAAGVALPAVALGVASIVAVAAGHSIKSAFDVKEEAVNINQIKLESEAGINLISNISEHLNKIGSTVSADYSGSVLSIEKLTNDLNPNTAMPKQDESQDMYRGMVQ